MLAEAVASVRELDESLWAAQSDDDLVAVVACVEELRSALAAVQAGAVAEADARGLAKHRLHYGSTGDWLTHVGGLRKGEGRRVVARAHALTGPLASTRAAMTAGRVSPEQADVIVRSVEALPSGEGVRRRGERTLLEHAGSLDATELARSGRHLVHVVWTSPWSPWGAAPGCRGGLASGMAPGKLTGHAARYGAMPCLTSTTAPGSRASATSVVERGATPACSPEVGKRAKVSATSTPRRSARREVGDAVGGVSRGGSPARRPTKQGTTGDPTEDSLPRRPRPPPEP